MSKTNKVQLVGYLGQKPTLKQITPEQCVLSVSMSTSETYKNPQGEKVQTTEWHNLVAFGKVANLINNYGDKGSHVMMNGRLKTRQYTDKSGNDRYVTEIIIEDILFLNRAKTDSTNQ